MDATSQAITNVNIDSGNIDGATIATSDVTVGAGKTLDVSAGTLHWLMTRSVVIRSAEALSAMDANSQAITNVNIDSGNIDGVTIATSDVTVGAARL